LLRPLRSLLFSGELLYLLFFGVFIIYQKIWSIYKKVSLSDLFFFFMIIYLFKLFNLRVIIIK
jgi:hypothetical protein